VRQKIWDVVGECGTGITDREKIDQIESILLDSLTAVYTITDKDGNVTQFSELYSSTNTSISIDLFQYLKSGNNTVSVLLKGTSTGAIAGYTFIIVLLTL